MVIEQNTLEEQILFQIAPRLKRLHERLWSTDNVASVSYPSAAQARIAAIEDSSFWFRHRTSVIVAIVGKHPPEGTLLDVGDCSKSLSMLLAI